MIIGVCGYGYSGSGAVLDFLREIHECSCTLQEWEFDLSYIPHGIQDLEYQLMERRTRYLSSDRAIKDFWKLICEKDSPNSVYRKKTGRGFRMATEAMLNDLVQISWKGTHYLERYYKNTFYRFYWMRKMKLIHLYEKHRKKEWPYYGKDRVCLSIAPDNFYERVREYVRDVLAMLGHDFNKIVVLNQPFDVYAPDRSMKFFDDPVAVLVDRDPRDIYVLVKKVLMGTAGFIPVETVDQYIKYFRLVRQQNLQKDQSEVIKVRYEDLVYDYENTSAWLLRQLNLKDTHRDQKKYFAPEISIENTQLFLKYQDLEEDIGMIERELPEFLYPFDKYSQKPIHSATPF